MRQQSVIPRNAIFVVHLSVLVDLEAVASLYIQLAVMESTDWPRIHCEE